jgi:very-short-patch-repair endonuclease
MSQLKNKSYLIKYRKNLRKKVTPAEAVLWKYIKSEKLEGIKFRRQYSVNNYILDFYCPKFKLAIELDGAHHFSEEGIINDSERDEYLKSVGIKVLRFENDLIMKRLETVLSIILEEIQKTPLSRSSTSPLG